MLLRWRFLILYQAYGNLCAMTGRKSHLLEDKQIPSVVVFDEVSFYTLFQAFGKLLEEIHVTWTQFGKKRDKITTLHEVVSRKRVQCLETASQFLATPSEFISDDVKSYVTASERRKSQQSLVAVPAVPDISGGRPAYQWAVTRLALPFLSFSREGKTRGEVGGEGLVASIACGGDDNELVVIEEVGEVLLGRGDGGEGGRL
ncbi:hypothetical protein Tco_0030897 [Tanacetum coccineum]